MSVLEFLFSKKEAYKLQTKTLYFFWISEISWDDVTVEFVFTEPETNMFSSE